MHWGLSPFSFFSVLWLCLSSGCCKDDIAAKQCDMDYEGHSSIFFILLFLLKIDFFDTMYSDYDSPSPNTYQILPTSPLFPSESLALSLPPSSC